MVVLIIFHVILQTVINLKMLSIGGQKKRDGNCPHALPAITPACWAAGTKHINCRMAKQHIYS